MMCNKTPISLMNEVCKANNVVPEYKVVEESGPPHEKLFKVELTLPEVGSYEGVASTIRGAKHKAAQLGLETSGLTKPERKSKQFNDAPSVELNALAMRQGKIVQYCDLPGMVKHHNGPSPMPSYGGYHYSEYTPGVVQYHRPHIKMMVSVKVGEKEYFGEGFRKKDARRNAASKALADLRQELKVEPKVEQNQLAQAPDKIKSEMPEPKVITVDGEASSLKTQLLKSPISEVHEIASQRKMKIDFVVVSSTGPPHNRMFVTTVTVGEFSASGEGSSKKLSKHLASSKVLEDLRKLPPLAKSHAASRLYQHGGYGKKTHKDLDPSLNPISLLGQLRQRRKETLPVYTLVGEEGVRSKEFTIQVQVDSHTARGSGANKKEAKKNAAEAMLQLLGIRSTKPSGADSNSDKTPKQSQGEEKSGQKESGSEGRSLPPGLLPILPEMANRNVVSNPTIAPPAIAPPAIAPPVKPLQNIAQPTAPTVTVLNRAPGAPVGKPMSDEILQNGSTPSMQKLQQLAKSGGFQVQYQDTTQENNEQFLAVVTISTVPPLVCRGFGPTLEHAFEHAAANALVPLLQPPVGTNGPVADAAPGN